MKKYLFIILFAACHRDMPNAEQHGVTPPYPEGITQIGGDSLAFCLFAPNKNSVHLIGDFNNWDVDACTMTQAGDYFWTKIGGLDPNLEYVCQYLVDGALRIADPYARKVSDINDRYIPAEIYPNLIAYPSDKTSEIAMAVSVTTDNYQWQTGNFSIADPANLIIYEILIRDFTQKRSIKGVEEKIPYLKELGITAVELMPFSEFEGNDSWGYNPSFYFAPDKAYGAAHDYKRFIDECHANGIAVIMDMVLNHSYGQSPMVRLYSKDGAVTADNPWYNVKSPNTSYSWGYDFNHESPHTQRFVDSVCAYWLREFRIDGFRFDFTKGFTNTSGDGWAYDAPRIAILKRMAQAIRSRKADAVIIFEHLAENREEKELAQTDIINLWGNMNYNVNEATMGYGAESGSSGKKGDISWASYQQRGWSNPNLVAYMESHDEERLMYKNKTWGKTASGYDVKDIRIGLQRTAAAAVVFFALPAPKMLWQFGELGYDYKLGSSMEDGRLDKKPIRWDYLDDPDRRALHDVYAAMFALRKSKASLFSTRDYAVSLTDNFKYVVLRAADGAAIAMANFDAAPLAAIVPFTAGEWREYFTGSALNAAADGTAITLEAGEYRLYLK